MAAMLKRDDYLEIIEDIRNTEKKSLDEYISKVLEPLRSDNDLFIETLYKDIHYLLDGIDRVGENDLAIENGDLVIEDGDLKLTGYQSRLHNLCSWLHMEICNKFLEKDPFSICENMETFQKSFVEKTNYTPEYKAKLDKIKRSLRQERRQNLGLDTNFWNMILDTDNLELKPNIFGIGLNLNNIINKFKKQ